MTPLFQTIQSIIMQPALYTLQLLCLYPLRCHSGHSNYTFSSSPLKKIYDCRINRIPPMQGMVRRRSRWLGRKTPKFDDCLYRHGSPQIVRPCRRWTLFKFRNTGREQGCQYLHSIRYTYTAPKYQYMTVSPFPIVTSFIQWNARNFTDVDDLFSPFFFWIWNKDILAGWFTIVIAELWETNSE